MGPQPAGHSRSREGAHNTEHHGTRISHSACQDLVHRTGLSGTPDIAGSVGRSNLENGCESRSPILQRQLNAVRSKADRVVPAAQHQQVENLGFRQLPG